MRPKDALVFRDKEKLDLGGNTLIDSFFLKRRLLQYLESFEEFKTYL